MLRVRNHLIWNVVMIKAPRRNCQHPLGKVLGSDVPGEAILRWCNFFCALTEQAKYLPGNVAIEATDRLQPGVTFSDSAGDIGLRTSISAKPSNDNDVQFDVRNPLAATLRPAA